MRYLQKMDGSVMYRGRGALGMAVVVLFAIVLRCGAFSRVPDRFRGALEELGVPPGGVSWPTKPPESPPMSPPTQPSPFPSPSPPPSPSPQESPLQSIPRPSESSEPAGEFSLDSADEHGYDFKLPEAPPGFKPPAGISSSIEDFDSYFTQVQKFGAFGSPVQGNGAVRYPYMASITKSNSHHCTGVLIKPNVVLTAAHCVDPRRNRASQLAVKFFRLQNGSQKEESIKVSKIKMYPKYRGPRGGFNLALVKMVSSPSEAYGIRFMGQGDLELDPNERFLSLGWGRTSQSSAFSPVLQKTYLPVLKQDSCSRSMRRRIRYTEFCAGAEGQGPCPGDDGGPLLRRGLEAKSDVLVGMATSQLVCGMFRKPDVFTRVSEYRSWLVSELDKL